MPNFVSLNLFLTLVVVLFSSELTAALPIIKDAKNTAAGIQIHSTCLGSANNQAFAAIDALVDATRLQVSTAIQKYPGANIWWNEWLSASRHLVFFCVGDEELPGFNAAYIQSPARFDEIFPNRVGELNVKWSLWELAYSLIKYPTTFAEMGVTPVVMSKKVFSLMASGGDQRLQDLLLHEVLHATGANNLPPSYHNLVPGKYVPSYKYNENAAYDLDYVIGMACDQFNMTNDRVYVLSALAGESEKYVQLAKSVRGKFALCQKQKSCFDLMSKSSSLTSLWDLKSSALSSTGAEELCSKISSEADTQ